MRKEDVLIRLDQAQNSLEQLRVELSRIKTDNVYRKDVKQLVNQISIRWFEEVDPVLPTFGVSDEVKTKYHNLFDKLLNLSVKVSRRKSYLQVLEDVLANLKNDLSIPIMKSVGKIVSMAHLAKVLENVSDEEKEYLDEALGCASHGFLRGSVVLGWNAAVHRLHKVIERLGFDQFNKKSEEMKNITDGRFKRFKKSYNVHSLSELRATVFDNDLLWVLEYWGLIDSNQHERLSICFTMRNNSAHPGEAPITEENLASFYSDLKSIVFDNPKFKV